MAVAIRPHHPDHASNYASIPDAHGQHRERPVSSLALQPISQCQHRSGGVAPSPRPRALSISRGGQALAELAVFGSLLLVLLGYLVSNVLRYDFQQQAKMEAFRRSLASASETVFSTAPVSISTVLLEDRHIPNPQDPFGVGQITPTMAQAGVTRKYNMQNVPKDDKSLPTMELIVEGAQGCPSGKLSPITRPGRPGQPPTLVCRYTMAGFRDEYGVTQAAMDRYRFIYGGTNVCDKAECGGGYSGCITEETGENPETGRIERACVEYLYHLRIIDSCEGEIISRDDCVRRAAQIVSVDACEAACSRAGASLDCRKMCDVTMEVPSYAAGASSTGGQWVAPALDGMLTAAGVASTGLQPGVLLQEVVTDNQLDKREGGGGVTTTTAIDVTATTDRVIALKRSNSVEAVPLRSETKLNPPEEAWGTSW